jgi:hypothetical protein
MIYRYMQDNRLWKTRPGRQVRPVRAHGALPPA